MRYVTGIILLALSFSAFSAFSSDRENLLLAWENIQKNQPQVESFQKVSDGKYKIKFSVLPYDGELVVLTYDTEDVNFDFIKDNPFSKRGYVNVDLVDADEKTLNKYGRSYFKWIQSNTLYLNMETKKWVSSEEYTNYITEATKEKTQNNVLFFLSGYWDYILLIIFAYFIFTGISGNKLFKKSLKMQSDSVADMEQIKKVQDEAITLHKETNQLLREMLDELKKTRS